MAEIIAVTGLHVFRVIGFRNVVEQVQRQTSCLVRHAIVRRLDFLKEHVNQRGSSNHDGGDYAAEILGYLEAFVTMLGDDPEPAVAAVVEDVFWNRVWQSSLLF